MDNNIYTEVFEQLFDACIWLVKALKELWRKFTEALVKAFHWFTDLSTDLCAMLDAWRIEHYEEKSLGSMRVSYLALHAKKHRVRKKNMNRIRKAVEKSCA